MASTLLLEALKDKGTRLVALGWSAFIAENAIVTHNRDFLIDLLGDEQRYTTCYGVMSTACLAATGLAYARRGRGSGPLLFAGTSIPPGRAVVAYFTQGLGLVGVSQMLPPLAPPQAAADAPLQNVHGAPGGAVAGGTSVGAAAAVDATSAVLPVASGSTGGCPVPRWLRGSRSKPEGHDAAVAAAMSDQVAAQATPETKGETIGSGKASGTSSGNSVGGDSGSGCPMPRWLRFGRPVPEGHPPTSTAATPTTPPGDSAVGAGSLAAVPMEASAPSGGGGGCPVPAWLRGGRPIPEGHPPSGGGGADNAATIGVAATSAKSPHSNDSVADATLVTSSQPVTAVKPLQSELVYGAERVTRHVVFWSLGFIGLGAALTSRHSGCAALYLGPAAVAALGGSHQDHRHRVSGKLTPEKDAVTSGLPFGALLTGKQSWQALRDELDTPNAFGACILATLLALRRLVRPF
eukprot:TRINITY_DN15801_c0_g3_i1.p1 TRINITY_DN15801_c0_g3~~TRINITY_DN15801_c0_g3_i1.p1  ORF type:complete len:464 (-),score=87.02 TRINITY_DN15801_c0_g3_i1:63-1454(-)